MLKNLLFSLFCCIGMIVVILVLLYIVLYIISALIYKIWLIDTSFLKYFKNKELYEKIAKGEVKIIEEELEEPEERRGMSINIIEKMQIQDSDTGEFAEEGDILNYIIYIDEGRKIKLEEVYICDIRNDKITLEVKEFEEVTIQIYRIVDFKKER